jgi:hypothetical protein
LTLRSFTFCFSSSSFSDSWIRSLHAKAVGVCAFHRPETLFRLLFVRDACEQEGIGDGARAAPGKEHEEKDGAVDTEHFLLA